MEIYRILAKAVNLEGPLLDIGFGKGIFSSNILSGMKDNKITKRNFVAFDTFNRYGGNIHPRWAIDFKNNAINKAGISTYIEFGLAEKHLPQVIKNYNPAIVHINLPTHDQILQALKKSLQNIRHGALIVVDTNKDKTVKVVNKFCKENFLNFTLASEGDYSYIIKGDRIKTNRVNPLLQQVGNTVKRERSVNLT